MGVQMKPLVAAMSCQGSRSWLMSVQATPLVAAMSCQGSQTGWTAQALLGLHLVAERCSGTAACVLMLANALLPAPYISRTVIPVARECGETVIWATGPAILLAASCGRSELASA